MMHAGLLPHEAAFLAAPPTQALGRMATVGRRGMPLVVPVGWRFDAGAGEIVLGGRDVPATARWRHVASSHVAALVIDGIDLTAGAWTPWGITLRGAAWVSSSERAIRLRPDHVHSYNLDRAG